MVVLEARTNAATHMADDPRATGKGNLVIDHLGDEAMKVCRV